MPVYKILQEMPYDELVKWSMYLAERPIGWREDLRASYIMQSMGDTRKQGDIFPSLSVLSKKQAAAANLKSSALFQRMLTAKGGDQPAFMKELDAA